MLGNKHAMSSRSSLLSLLLPSESELVTACMPFLTTRRLELCVLRGTLERLEIESKEVVAAWVIASVMGSVRVASVACARGGAVGFGLGEGISTAFRYLCCDEGELTCKSGSSLAPSSCPVTVRFVGDGL